MKKCKIFGKMGEMEYFEKLDKNPYGDLYWNVPEQRQGKVNVIGGNGQSFRGVVRTAEILADKYPLAEVRVVMPESLQKLMPGGAQAGGGVQSGGGMQAESKMQVKGGMRASFRAHIMQVGGRASEVNLEFLPATENGSFSGEGLAELLDAVDYNLLAGELSKNAVTGREVARAVAGTNKPILATREAVDLMAENQPEAVLMNGRVNLLASMVQLKKLLEAVYYPRRLLMTQSLLQVAETLHKFTLSYGVGVVTLHDGQIIVAQGGVVKAVALTETEFTPISIWNGELATKILALNLYNPGDFVKASVAAIYYK